MPTNSNNNQRASATRRRAKTGRPDKEILADIIQRVVEVAQPDKIILFGSAARGEMGPNSDIDLLVIKRGKFNHWRLLTAIYRHLPAVAAVDVVLASAEDIERYADSPYLIYYPALREGKIVHGA
ncbi:MAG TPA: nucleotidyltransferase domain-containing protein [Pirellulales bacterium]|nr:nucleotidyltransferase domain-containing protein [Pirellulales bacterium]